MAGTYCSVTRLLCSWTSGNARPERGRVLLEFRRAGRSPSRSRFFIGLQIQEHENAPSVRLYSSVVPLFFRGVELRFERSHIDDESVFHIAFEHPFVSFVDLVHTDHFDVGGDSMFAAEIEHLLRFGNSGDHRNGQTFASTDHADRPDRERFLRCTDETT